MTFDPESPEPEAAPAPDRWTDIDSSVFDLVVKWAVGIGGRLETNIKGSEFCYYGERTMNGRKAPILIAVRHPLTTSGARKCRANMTAVEALK